MKKQYIIAIVIIALLGTIAFAVPAVIKEFVQSNPSTQLLYAFSETAKAEKVHSVSTASFEIDLYQAKTHEAFSMYEDPEAMVFYMNSILSGMEIQSFSTYSTEDLLYSVNSFINYKNNPLLNVSSYLDSSMLALQVPQLSSRLFSLEFNKDGSFDLEKYREILMQTDDDAYKALEKNKDDYLEPLMEFLDVHVRKLDKEEITFTNNAVESTYKTDQLALEFSDEEMYAFLEVIFNIMAEDEQMRAYVKNRGELLLTALIDSEDYTYLSMTKEDAIDLKESFINDFNSGYDSMIEEMKSALETVSVEGNAIQSSSYQLLFNIDSDAMIRRIRVTNLTDFIKSTTIYDYIAFNDNVVPDVLSLQDRTDITMLIEDEEEIGEVVSEVIGNLFTNVLSGEAFDTLLNDLKTNVDVLPESEQMIILDGIDEFMNSIQILPFLFMDI